MFLFLVRVCVFRIGFTGLELFPLLFCTALYFGIILLGEVNASYDSFFVVPFALNVAVLSNDISQAKVHGRNALPRLQIASRVVRFFAPAGIMIAIVVLGVSGLSGYIQRNRECCFASPCDVEHESSSDGDNQPAFRVSSDDDGVYAEVALMGRQTDGTNDTATIRWSVPCTAGKPLHCFLAANQRKLRILSADARESAMATQFSLFVDGRRIASGDLNELRNPKLLSLSPENSVMEFRAELRNLVTAAEQREVTPAADLTGFSVEYFWQ